MLGVARTAAGHALEGDRAFHLAIVEACDNVVLTETVLGFWDSRKGPIFTRLGGYFETVKSWRSAIAEHEAIRDAIAARDAGAARIAAVYAEMAAWQPASVVDNSALSAAEAADRLQLLTTTGRSLVWTPPS